MTTLCSAFGVFSAFGVAILAFFTAGGGLQRMSAWLVRRGKENSESNDTETEGEAAGRGGALVWLVAGVVALTVIISGVGLFTSFLWLVNVANGPGHVPKWAYKCAEVMFYIEAVLITVITVVAVIGSAFAALPPAKTPTPEISELTPVGQAVTADDQGVTSASLDVS
jgi:hypothetical protein